MPVLEKLPEIIGHALINQRAGMDNVVYNLLHRERSVLRMQLQSPAFGFNARIPVRFTADGEGISPPLSWDGVPAQGDSLVLIVEDADAPTPHPLVHAIVAGFGALATWRKAPSAARIIRALACRPAAIRFFKMPGCRPIRRRAMASIAMCFSCSP
jgi:hypothetical protein